MKLWEAARTFMGAKWRHQGRRPDAMDCLGLVVLSLRLMGVDVHQDRIDYGRTPHNKRLRAGIIAQLGQPVPIAELEPGMIVTMKWTGEENHVAIVTPHPDYGLGLIHCYSFAPGGAACGRVIEHGLSDDWRALIVEAWRVAA
ncbi:C40 family peptidase [Lysobacter fragariae]